MGWDGWYTTMSRADRLNTTPYYMNLEVRYDGTRSPDAAGATQGILLSSISVISMMSSSLIEGDVFWL